MSTVRYVGMRRYKRSTGRQCRFSDCSRPAIWKGYFVTGAGFKFPTAYCEEHATEYGITTTTE